VTTVGNRIVLGEGRHSNRGASSSDRVIGCAGSVNLIEKLSKAGTITPKTNPAAAEGTAAHLILSTCLEDGTDAQDMAGMEIEVANWVFPVDKEMIEGVQESLDWVRARIAKARSDGFEVNLYVEKMLESFTDDDAYGTGDVLIHIITDRMIVFDFKYGRGITCEPTSNQNKYYGALACETYLAAPDDIKVVESWIGQPRIPHPAGTIRRHITNVDELTKWWFGTMLPSIRASREDDAMLTIGSWCRFCPARGHCPALKQETMDFPIDIDPTFLTTQELGEMLAKLEAIVVLKPVVEAEAYKRAKGGEKIPGKKHVNKRSNRVFQEELPIDRGDGEMVVVTLKQAVEIHFGPDAYTEPELKSPAQIDKLEGGKTFTKLWSHKPFKGTTLAPLTDKRAEIMPAIERFRAQRS